MRVEGLPPGASHDADHGKTDEGDDGSGVALKIAG